MDLKEDYQPTFQLAAADYSNVLETDIPLHRPHHPVPRHIQVPTQDYAPITPEPYYYNDSPRKPPHPHSAHGYYNTYSPVYNASPRYTQFYSPTAAGAAAVAAGQTSSSSSSAGTYAVGGFSTSAPYPSDSVPQGEASYWQSPVNSPLHHQPPVVNHPPQHYSQPPQYMNSPSENYGLYSPTNSGPMPQVASASRRPYVMPTSSYTNSMRVYAHENAMRERFAASEMGYGREAGFVPFSPSSKLDKSKIKKRKDPNAPKNPMSAYLYFLVDERAKQVEVGPNAKVLGAKWKSLSDEEKAPYEELAKKDKERYIKEKAAYGNKSIFVPENQLSN